MKKKTKILIILAVVVWFVIISVNQYGIENFFPAESAMVTLDSWEGGKITATFEDGKQKTFSTSQAGLGAFCNLDQRRPENGERVKLFYRGPFALGMKIWEQLEIESMTEADVVCVGFYPDQSMITVQFANGWEYGFCYEEDLKIREDLKVGDALHIEYDGWFVTKMEKR